MKYYYNSQICSHTPSALNAGAKRSGATCHMNLGKLVENNSSKTTRRKQLVENTRRKTRRKATRRKFSGGKLVARTENNLRQI